MNKVSINVTFYVDGTHERAGRYLDNAIQRIKDIISHLSKEWNVDGYIHSGAWVEEEFKEKTNADEN